MSFSSDVKRELVSQQPPKDCCAAAEAYGLLEFGHSFSAFSISLKTENDAIADAYRSFVSNACGRKFLLFCLSTGVGGIHNISVPDASDRIRIIERFGHSISDVTIRINRANFECENCAAAYLRGAFLSCGAITDPKSGYHLELSTPYHRLSNDMQTLMLEMNLQVRLVRRKGNNIIYLKESGQIEDCLTTMGATDSTLEFMGIKVIKNIRNNANRITNCENANIDKTINAAMDQVLVIRKIDEKVGLDSLPDELKEIAVLRLENPDMSLRELGEKLKKPLSRSGVNHRMRRLMEFNERLGKGCKD